MAYRWPLHAAYFPFIIGKQQKNLSWNQHPAGSNKSPPRTLFLSRGVARGRLLERKPSIDRSTFPQPLLRAPRCGIPPPPRWFSTFVWSSCSWRACVRACVATFLCGHHRMARKGNQQPERRASSFSGSCAVACQF